jgi:hypothetical protein
MLFETFNGIQEGIYQRAAIDEGLKSRRAGL